MKQMISLSKKAPPAITHGMELVYSATPYLYMGIIIITSTLCAVLYPLQVFLPVCLVCYIHNYDE